MYANLSPSQFKTFRADVRNEVRKIANEISAEVIQQVQRDARRIATYEIATAVNNSRMAERLENVERVISTHMLGPMPKPQRMGLRDCNAAVVRDGSTITQEDGQEFTYFRGEWRRPSEIEAMAACARGELSKKTDILAEAKNVLNDATFAFNAAAASVRSFTEIGF